MSVEGYQELTDFDGEYWDRMTWSLSSLSHRSDLLTMMRLESWSSARGEGYCGYCEQVALHVERALS